MSVGGGQANGSAPAMAAGRAGGSRDSAGGSLEAGGVSGPEGPPVAVPRFSPSGIPER